METARNKMSLGCDPHNSDNSIHTIFFRTIPAAAAAAAAAVMHGCCSFRTLTLAFNVKD